MQVDFYQLTRDRPEKLVPVLAQKVMDAGKRLLIVSAAAAEREQLSAALWNAGGDSFLAHGQAGDGGEAKQPILLSDMAEAGNNATFMLIGDGAWRGAVAGMERIFYLFLPEHTDAARQAWRDLGEADGVTCKYWRQDGGRWVEGP